MADSKRSFSILIGCLLFLGVLLAVGLFYGVVSGRLSQAPEKEPVVGNITFVKADLEQWQALGTTHTATATFHRDGVGAEEVSGNFTFGLPDDYTTQKIAFANWSRDSDLTVEFTYTVPADGYAGALSPEYRLDIDGNATATFDHLNETGRYIFATFSIADPEPDKANLGNDDLSTLVPVSYYDPRFEARKDDAYNNSLNASKALTLGQAPYRTKDLYGALKNVTAYANSQMVTDVERWQKDPYYGELTQSDWYLGYNESGFGPRYHGICKDYVSLARSYYRSMGVPAKFIICVEKDKNGTLFSHAWLEVYSGERWIHADPAWNVFDNPRHYVNSGYYDIEIRELSVCQKKPTSIKSSGEADDLIFQAWIFWDPEDKIDFEIVTDRGKDMMYN